MTRNEIMALQRDLNAQGFRDQNGRQLKVDGIMGPRTRHAMEQRDTNGGEARDMPTPRPKPDDLAARPGMAVPRDHPNRPSLRRDINDFASQTAAMTPNRQMGAMREPAQPPPAKPLPRDPDGATRSGTPLAETGDRPSSFRMDTMRDAEANRYRSSEDRQRVAGAQAPSRVTQNRQMTGMGRRPADMAIQFPEESPVAMRGGDPYQTPYSGVDQFASTEPGYAEGGRRPAISFDDQPAGEMPWDQQAPNPMVAEGAPPPTDGQGWAVLDALRSIFGSDASVAEPPAAPAAAPPARRRSDSQFRNDAESMSQDVERMRAESEERRRRNRETLDSVRGR